MYVALGLLLIAMGVTSKHDGRSGWSREIGELQLKLDEKLTGCQRTVDVSLPLLNIEEEEAKINHKTRRDYRHVRVNRSIWDEIYNIGSGVPKVINKPNEIIKNVESLKRKKKKTHILISEPEMKIRLVRPGGTVREIINPGPIRDKAEQTFKKVTRNYFDEDTNLMRFPFFSSYGEDGISTDNNSTNDVTPLIEGFPSINRPIFDDKYINPINQKLGTTVFNEEYDYLEHFEECRHSTATTRKKLKKSSKSIKNHFESITDINTIKCSTVQSNTLETSSEESSLITNEVSSYNDYEKIENIIGEINEMFNNRKVLENNITSSKPIHKTGTTRKKKWYWLKRRHPQTVHSKLSKYMKKYQLNKKLDKIHPTTRRFTSSTVSENNEQLSTDQINRNSSTKSNFTSTVNTKNKGSCSCNTIREAENKTTYFFSSTTESKTIPKTKPYNINNIVIYSDEKPKKSTFTNDTFLDIIYKELFKENSKYIAGNEGEKIQIINVDDKSLPDFVDTDEQAGQEDITVVINVDNEVMRDTTENLFLNPISAALEKMLADVKIKIPDHFTAKTNKTICRSRTDQTKNSRSIIPDCSTKGFSTVSRCGTSKASYTITPAEPKTTKEKTMATRKLKRTTACSNFILNLPTFIPPTVHSVIDADYDQIMGEIEVTQCPAESTRSLSEKLFGVKFPSTKKHRKHYRKHLRDDLFRNLTKLGWIPLELQKLLIDKYLIDATMCPHTCPELLENTEGANAVCPHSTHKTLSKHSSKSSKYTKERTNWTSFVSSTQCILQSSDTEEADDERSSHVTSTKEICTTTCKKETTVRCKDSSKLESETSCSSTRRGTNKTIIDCTCSGLKTNLPNTQRIVTNERSTKNKIDTIKMKINPPQNEGFSIEDEISTQVCITQTRKLNSTTKTTRETNKSYEPKVTIILDGETEEEETEISCRCGRASLLPDLCKKTEEMKCTAPNFTEEISSTIKNEINISSKKKVNEAKEKKRTSETSKLQVKNKSRQPFSFYRTWMSPWAALQFKHNRPYKASDFQHLLNQPQIYLVNQYPPVPISDEDNKRNDLVYKSANNQKTVGTFIVDNNLLPPGYYKLDDLRKLNFLTSNQLTPVDSHYSPINHISQGKYGSPYYFLRRMPIPRKARKTFRCPRTIRNKMNQIIP